MKRRGRPPSFSRQELVTAARQLGPDGIGLQPVAAALGVSRTSLYWHVRDQDELGELVLAELVHEASTGDWAPPEDAGWEVWLDAYARSLRTTLLAGGAWLRYGSGRFFYSRRTLRNADHLLAALLAAGFAIEEASHAFEFVSEVVQANVRATTGADLPREAGRDSLLAELRSLDADDVPNLRHAVVVSDGTSHDRQFEYDLATALAGIAARAGVEQR
ncbi:MAG: Tetracyclin repressor protein [Actinomycetia bacterium]|nr:Tetracyclin repressor protein [Actinomycetes bacterium]